MAAMVGGILYGVVSGEMAFIYDNVYILQQGGRWRILTRQMREVLRPYQNLSLISPGWIILGTSH